MQYLGQLCTIIDLMFLTENVSVDLRPKAASLVNPSPMPYWYLIQAMVAFSK